MMRAARVRLNDALGRRTYNVRGKAGGAYGLELDRERLFELDPVRHA